MNKHLQRYAAIFGRSPSVVRPESAASGTAAALFPAQERKFWRMLMSEAYDQWIYITAGLSLHEMPVPPEYRKVTPTRIELVAITNGAITGGETGTEDIPTYLLQEIADQIVQQNLAVAPGHTIDCGERIGPNIEMSAFLFAVPDGFNVKRVCSGAPAAQMLLSLVPISPSELAFVRESGVDALITKFEENHVPPLFDPFRKSVV